MFFRRFVQSRTVLAATGAAWAFLALPALAMDEDLPCGAASFPITPGQTALAKVTPGPQLHFLADRDKAGCPSTKPACVRKAYVISGDLLVTSKSRGDLICATYPGGAIGWLPRERIATRPAPAIPVALSDWGGDWTFRGGGTTADLNLTIEGRALKATGNANAVVSSTPGDVNTGEIDELVATPAGDHVLFGKMALNECGVEARRYGPFLIVRDNYGCGGVGVSFTGVYRRRP